jgi:hypothetical protein
VSVPVFVGAGTGQAIATGSVTVTKTGCIAGNIVFFHFVIRGLTGDWSAGNPVNVEAIDGVASDYTTVVTGAGTTGLEHGLFIGRVTANGTVSFDMACGASSEDMYGRIYEFSGASTSPVLSGVIEEGTSAPQVYTSFGLTGATSIGALDVQSLGADRLALHFMCLNTNQAVGDFTGETGGNWTEATAEFASAVGATATLQLQTASMPSAGTISGGLISTTTTNWGIVGMALIPAVGSVPGIGGSKNLLTLGAG